tara:strand:- start:184 stop:528 length:345 start_codon:yes stop_codon:yes gene_type:complete
MNKKLKITKTEIKSHLIAEFGDEIQNQIFDLVRWVSWSEMGRIEDELYYYSNSNYIRKGIDDGDPFFEINNINLDQMIDIVTMDFSYSSSITTHDDTENKYDLLSETIMELDLT